MDGLAVAFCEWWAWHTVHMLARQDQTEVAHPLMPTRRQSERRQSQSAPGTSTPPMSRS